MLALQLAEKRPDIIKQLICVDGSLESDSWIASDKADQRKLLAQIDSMNQVLQESAEEWRSFNGASYRYRKDSIRHEDVRWAFLESPVPIWRIYGL